MALCFEYCLCTHTTFSGIGDFWGSEITWNIAGEFFQGHTVSGLLTLEDDQISELLSTGMFTACFSAHFSISFTRC